MLINFTNPAGIITQAISLYGGVKVVGVCDTPSATLQRLGEFLGAVPERVSFSYSGLNHLGWVPSFSVEGEERIGDLLRRFDELHASTTASPPLTPRWSAGLGPCRRSTCSTTTILAATSRGWRRPGTSRGQDVLRLNEELLGGIARSFEKGDVEDAWSTYSLLLGVRNDTYMRTDTEGDNHQTEARLQRASEGPAPIDGTEIGGYEGLALEVRRRAHLPPTVPARRQHAATVPACPSWPRTTSSRCRRLSTEAASSRWPHASFPGLPVAW